MRHQAAEDLVETYLPPKAMADQWDAAGLEEAVKEFYGLELPIAEWAAEEGIADEEILERLTEAADKTFAERAANAGPDLMRRIEKSFLLEAVDTGWREHLQNLESLRSVIGLRSFAQRDPLNEYKTEAFTLFERLMDNLRTDVTGRLMKIRVERAPQPPQMPELPEMEATHIDPRTGRNDADPEGPIAGTRTAPTLRRAKVAMDPTRPETWGRVPRNAACPCGSGKKYKHCHGAVGGAAAE
jgi:preprotein translocase subunit SecA